MAEAEACAGREESGSEENGDEDPVPASTGAAYLRAGMTSPLTRVSSAAADAAHLFRRVWTEEQSDASDAVPHGKTLEEPRLLRRHAWPERRARGVDRALQDLARRPLRELVEEHDPARVLVRGHPLLRPRLELVGGGCRAGAPRPRPPPPPRPVARPRFRRRQFEDVGVGVEPPRPRGARSRRTSSRSSCRRGTGSARRRGTRRRRSRASRRDRSPHGSSSSCQ